MVVQLVCCPLQRAVRAATAMAAVPVAADVAVSVAVTIASVAVVAVAVVAVVPVADVIAVAALANDDGAAAVPVQSSLQNQSTRKQKHVMSLFTKCWGNSSDPITTELMKTLKCH